MIKEIGRIAVYFLMFFVSFFCLSSLDLAKILLPVNNRALKAQLLLMLLSMALAYLAGSFIFEIMYKI